MESSLDKYQPRSEVELVLANYARADWSIMKKVPVGYLKGAKGNGSAFLQYYSNLQLVRGNPYQPRTTSIRGQ